MAKLTKTKKSAKVEEVIETPIEETPVVEEAPKKLERTEVVTTDTDVVVEKVQVVSAFDFAYEVKADRGTYTGLGFHDVLDLVSSLAGKADKITITKK